MTDLPAIYSFISRTTGVASSRLRPDAAHRLPGRRYDFIVSYVIVASILIASVAWLA